MKKVFAIIALMGVFTLGMTQSVLAQDEEANDSAAVEQVDSAAVEQVDSAEAAPVATDDEGVVEVGMYKQLKTKFIEGSAMWRGCRKTSVFLSRETGISGNFVGCIKGAKCPFDLQFLTWDFS